MKKQISFETSQTWAVFAVFISVCKLLNFLQNIGSCLLFPQLFIALQEVLISRIILGDALYAWTVMTPLALHHNCGYLN